mgnify:CR=1 FL=1
MASTSLLTKPILQIALEKKYGDVPEGWEGYLEFAKARIEENHSEKA